MKLKYSLERMIETMKRRKLLFFSLIVATLAIGVVIGTVINRSVDAARPGFLSGANAIAIPSPTQLSSEFSKVAKIVEPAVVNINTESILKEQPRSRRRAPFGGQPYDDPFDFFERFFGGPMEGPGREMRSRALGSGFIVDKSGYILTNFHVVEKADKINVRLDSGEEYPAKVIGKDEGTDLAVIKIEAKKELAVAKLGNSDGVTQGDWVLAFGSPFGFEHTVTAGIISATGRNTVGSQWQRFLQTDAAINQGNSGGPLVNMAGEVIGVSTAIITPTGANAGVGFALPSNTAANVYNQLVKSGKVTRGAIGILMQSVDAKVLRSLGAADGKGVVVSKITSPDGPAAKAGLKQGDIIREIDGRKINDSYELSSVVAELSPGKTVNLKYLRDSKEHSTSLVIADRGKLIPEESADATPEGEEETGRVKLGISVQSLTQQQAREFELRVDEGVIITNVQPGSVAEDAGLIRGDVILEVNRTPVRNPQELRDITTKLKSGTDVVFLVKRMDRSGEVRPLYFATTIP